MKRISRSLFLIPVLLLAALPRAEAILTAITITNNTDSALTLYDLSTGYVSTGFGGSHGVGPAPHVNTFMVEDTHTFYLSTYLFNGGFGGHTFTFSGGNIISANTNRYFQVDGTSIGVSGLELRIGLVSVPSGLPYEYICSHSGCNNIPGGYAYVGGPDRSVILPPNDGFFDGVYPLWQFFTSGANSIRLDMLQGVGIEEVTGTATSYAPDPSDLGLHGFVTLNNGRVLELTLIPEPTTAGLVFLAAFFGRRHWRHNRV